MSDIRSHLETIYQQRGELTPKIIVTEAAPTNHPLHTHFEWDNEIAGPKYREIQAAQLIRTAKIAWQGNGGEEIQVRAFWPIRGYENDETKSSYEPLEEIIQNPFSRKLLLSQMEREWKQFKQRYEHLEEFAGLITNHPAYEKAA